MARFKHAQSLEQDPQREVLYRMEFRELRGQWRGTKTAMKTLRRYVRLVCRLYGIPPCKLEIRTMNGFSGAYADGVVTLHPDFRCAMNMAHELAHYVTHKRYPNTKQDHGPRFVRIYAEVLHILRLMPLVGMKHICRKHGVKMARPAV